MPEEYRVGVVAIGCVASVAGVLAWLGGPVWYSVGPALIYAAYFVKLRVRGIRDKPVHVVFVLTAVSLAMIGFGVF
jgi:hypothetical protein